MNTVEQLRCWTCSREACMRRQVQFALLSVPKDKETARLLGTTVGRAVCLHVPLPSQCAIYETRVGWLLWGGRAGPGKSTGSRRWLYHRSLTVPGHEALLLRENLNQLKANHTIKMAQEVQMLGGVWKEGDNLAVFGKGSEQSLIYCGHMAEVDSLQRYVGIEYGAIVADEASLYPTDGDGIPVLSELSTRARRQYTNRSGEKVSGLFATVTNPGGPSAAWLKDMHIDHTPDFDKYPKLRPVFDEMGAVIEGYDPAQWQYIAASLKDNPYMRPDYAETQLAVLSEVRYKQLAEGDWNAFDGQFFREWDERVHVRRAVVIAA